MATLDTIVKTACTQIEAGDFATVSVSVDTPFRRPDSEWVVHRHYRIGRTRAVDMAGVDHAEHLGSAQLQQQAVDWLVAKMESAYRHDGKDVAVGVIPAEDALHMPLSELYIAYGLDTPLRQAFSAKFHTPEIGRIVPQQGAVILFKKPASVASSLQYG